MHRDSSPRAERSEATGITGLGCEEGTDFTSPFLKELLRLVKEFHCPHSFEVASTISPLLQGNLSINPIRGYLSYEYASSSKSFTY